MAVAKNYLSKDEIEALNLIVSHVSGFRRIAGQRPDARCTCGTGLRSWTISCVLSERDILTHPGKVSHDDALSKANVEYAKFRVLEERQAQPGRSGF